MSLLGKLLGVIEEQRIDGTRASVPFTTGVGNSSYALFEDDISNMPEGKTGPRITIATL